MTDETARRPPAAKANTTDGYADLGFKVTPQFRQRYKMASVMANVSMKDVMEESFRMWLEAKGFTI